MDERLCSIPAPRHAAAASHTWLLSTRNVASVAEELTPILFHFNSLKAFIQLI